MVYAEDERVKPRDGAALRARSIDEYTTLIATGSVDYISSTLEVIRCVVELSRGMLIDPVVLNNDVVVLRGYECRIFASFCE